MSGIVDYLRMRGSKNKWKEPIPVPIVNMMNRTRRLYLLWWTTHYGVGLTGLVATTLLTAITSSSNSNSSEKLKILAQLQDYSWLIGIIAAVSTSLVTFLGPLHKAERYYAAYHALEQSCLEYLDDGTNSKLKTLFDNVLKVRGSLQGADFSPKVNSVT